MQSPFQQQRDQDALQNALANLPGAAVNAGSVLLVGLTAGAGLLVGGRSPGVPTGCVHQASHSGSRPPDTGSGDERQASVSAQPHGAPSARRAVPFLARRQARSSSSGCRRSGRRPPAPSCTTCCAQRRIPAASLGKRCCSLSAHLKGLGLRNTQCWSMRQCHHSCSWTTFNAALEVRALLFAQVEDINSRFGVDLAASQPAEVATLYGLFLEASIPRAETALTGMVSHCHPCGLLDLASLAHSGIVDGSAM